MFGATSKEGILAGNSTELTGSSRVLFDFLSTTSSRYGLGGINSGGTVSDGELFDFLIGTVLLDLFT